MAPEKSAQSRRDAHTASWFLPFIVRMALLMKTCLYIHTGDSYELINHVHLIVQPAATDSPGPTDQDLYSKVPSCNLGEQGILTYTIPNLNWHVFSRAAATFEFYGGTIRNVSSLVLRARLALISLSMCTVT